MISSTVLRVSLKANTHLDEIFISDMVMKNGAQYQMEYPFPPLSAQYTITKLILTMANNLVVPENWRPLHIVTATLQSLRPQRVVSTKNNQFKTEFIMEKGCPFDEILLVFLPDFQREHKLFPVLIFTNIVDVVLNYEKRNFDKKLLCKAFPGSVRLETCASGT